MANKLIPEHIDPYRYAEQKLTTEGTVDLAEMARLGAMLHSAEGCASVSLQFGVDEQEVSFVKGHLTATLTLLCQRCLEPFKYNILSDFSLGIVNTVDEASALPSSYEPAMLAAGELALRELVEDELILNLPIIPKHEPEDCKAKIALPDSSGTQGEGQNPFLVLGKLKQK